MTHQQRTIFAENSLSDLMTGPIIGSETVRAAKSVWNRELEGGRDSYRTEEKQIAKPWIRSKSNTDHIQVL